MATHIYYDIAKQENKRKTGQIRKLKKFVLKKLAKIRIQKREIHMLEDHNERPTHDRDFYYRDARKTYHELRHLEGDHKKLRQKVTWLEDELTLRNEQIARARDREDELEQKVRTRDQQLREADEKESELERELDDEIGLRKALSKRVDELEGR